MLNLFVSFAGSHDEDGLPQSEDTVWVGQLIEVVESSHKRFPRLRNVTVSSIVEGALPVEVGFFARIRDACSCRHIAFETRWPHRFVATEQLLF